MLGAAAIEVIAGRLQLLLAIASGAVFLLHHAPQRPRQVGVPRLLAFVEQAKVGATIAAKLCVPYCCKRVMHKSTTEGTGAILMSWSGMPCSMYQAMASGDSGARP